MPSIEKLEAKVFQSGYSDRYRAEQDQKEWNLVIAELKAARKLLDSEIPYAKDKIAWKEARKAVDDA